MLAEDQGTLPSHISAGEFALDRWAHLQTRHQCSGDRSACEGEAACCRESRYSASPHPSQLRATLTRYEHLAKTLARRLPGGHGSPLRGPLRQGKHSRELGRSPAWSPRNLQGWRRCLGVRLAYKWGSIHRSKETATELGLAKHSSALSLCDTTFEFTFSRRLAKPAVASQVHRRVKPHWRSLAIAFRSEAPRTAPTVPTAPMMGTAVAAMPKSIV
jgi:hypothetical protein